MQRRHFIGQIVLVSAILDSKVYRNSAYQPMQRTTTRQSVDEILRLVAKTAATPDDHAPMQDQNFVLEFRLYLADTRFCCVVLQDPSLFPRWTFFRVCRREECESFESGRLFIYSAFVLEFMKNCFWNERRNFHIQRVVFVIVRVKDGLDLFSK